MEARNLRLLSFDQSLTLVVPSYFEPLPTCLLRIYLPLQLVRIVAFFFSKSTTRLRPQSVPR